MSNTRTGDNGARPGSMGVSHADGEDDPPVPMAFAATTVKVYAVPFVRPVTVHDIVLVVHVLLPGWEVTVYPVIALPPLSVGADHDTAT